MKRNNIVHYTLELIVILGYLVLGVTLLTYIIQKVPMDRVFIGFILIADGVIALTNYFTWRYSIRIKNIQCIVASLLTAALGVVLVLVDMEASLLCIILGSSCIGFSIRRIPTSVMNLTRQPLLNSIKIILSITEIVFSILLIIRTVNSLTAHMTFVGIAFAVEAFTLLVEFIVHRYQGI